MNILSRNRNRRQPKRGGRHELTFDGDPASDGKTVTEAVRDEPESTLVIDREAQEAYRAELARMLDAPDKRPDIPTLQRVLEGVRGIPVNPAPPDITVAFPSVTPVATMLAIGGTQPGAMVVLDGMPEVRFFRGKPVLHLGDDPHNHEEAFAIGDITDAYLEALSIAISELRAVKHAMAEPRLAPSFTPREDLGLKRDLAAVMARKAERGRGEGPACPGIHPETGGWCTIPVTPHKRPHIDLHHNRWTDNDECAEEGHVDGSWCIRPASEPHTMHEDAEGRKWGTPDPEFSTETADDAGQAGEPVLEGWAGERPEGRKAHYYREGAPLCPRGGAYDGPLTPDGEPSPDECKACRKVLDGETGAESAA